MALAKALSHGALQLIYKLAKPLAQAFIRKAGTRKLLIKPFPIKAVHRAPLSRESVLDKESHMMRAAQTK